NFGTTRAASTARMTSTRRSSMSVKPDRASAGAFLSVFVLLSFIPSIPPKAQGFLVDQILKRENRQEHANDDCPDDPGHAKEERRLGQRDEHPELPVEVGLVGNREPDQLLVKPACFLGHRHHFNDRCRKEEGIACKAPGQRRALLHFLDS